MEISRAKRGYCLGQFAYTQELLNQYGDEGYNSVIPIGKDMTEMLEEENITAAEV